MGDQRDGLSSLQRDTLLAAYHHGYFKVPRRTTLSELADEEGISDSALSQAIASEGSVDTDQSIQISRYGSIPRDAQIGYYQR